MTAQTATPIVNAKTMVAEARALRDEKDELNRDLKRVNGRIKELDYALLQYLEDEGLDKASIDGNTLIKSKKTVASVGDWDQFFEYVAEHSAWHLLQRRVSNNAAIETLEAGEEIPSVEINEFNELGFRRS